METKYPIDKLAHIVHGSLNAEVPDKVLISEVHIDSRKVVSPEGALFVALKTPSNDGHRFIPDLLKAGVRNFIVSQWPDNIDVKANYIKVDDTLKALQSFAAYHRGRFHYPLVAITGSNGKTIVKEWLHQLLSSTLDVVRSPKSFNSQIGVPLSLLQMSEHYDAAIIEAGISMPGEMDKLEDMIKPDYALITNIGHAHDENFVDKRQKLNEKIVLFKKARVIAYCRDHGDINQRILSIDAFRDKKIISWSRRAKDATLFIDEQLKKGGTEAVCYYDGREFTLTLPYNDKASRENIYHACLMALELGIAIEDVAEGVKNLAPVAMRLEMKEGIRSCSLINDVYNSDLNSIRIAVDFLRQQNQHKKKTLILSDILQSGMNDFTLYSKVAKLVNASDINHLIGVGKAIKKQGALFQCQKEFYDSTEDFLKYHPLYTFANETILLKGARAFAFEKIAQRLQKKTHQTVMEINLNALVENLKFYRSQLQADVKVMAMVKAFSYGSGSFEIANTLQFHRVDYLAVAYADEGVELRNAGIRTPILVMNPDKEAFDLMLNNSLEPEIYSLTIMQQLLTVLGDYDENRSIGIHIKIDTGMHRLGFEYEDLPALVKLLEQNKMVKVKSVFSHLVGSDSASFDDFTREQQQRFDKACAFLEHELQQPLLKHLLNSAGICRFPDMQYDMVRLGIGLYGLGHCKHSAKLQNVSSLKSIITQIKQIAPGESVGYNRGFVAGKVMRIATIPLGYADGFSRVLGQGIGHVKINGQKAPVVGHVCMDMIMVDVTDIDVCEGQEVVVFDSVQEIHELARLSQTIPYEVLTSISRRVKRIYTQE